MSQEAAIASGTGNTVRNPWITSSPKNLQTRLFHRDVLEPIDKSRVGQPEDGASLAFADAFVDGNRVGDEWKSTDLRQLPNLLVECHAAQHGAGALFGGLGEGDRGGGQGEDREAPGHTHP